MSQNNFEGLHQQSTHNYVQQEESREEMEQPDRNTPLCFALRMNGTYYVSYKKGQLWPMIIVSIVWAIINLLLISYLRTFQNINPSVKNGIEIGLISQVILFLIICFLDAGTIFEDEQDTYSEQRVYCVTCLLYRLRSTKHCLYCNRCVKTYDHHCGFFGKCIGRRNLVPFWLFTLVTGLQMPTFIFVLVTQSLGSQ